ncbi:DNA replication/repair protein RecF [Paenibacillus chitinolyticus]|uniref:DNA replication and repair protein RecF n=1 Tax=Paenibacillus chitinolyticus TaxID=79263 RepID=A0A410WQI5_9BACL|nr:MULTISPECIES: DNA replication/repair protein RecF [Paenibacillus]MCY9593913.1 DNA replication/repair protein RecF [Paenibacillus chitinolyticus]MCY9599558.1 DNA replication/repair protein RecF [Paenibacillus chitinolyticus]QAV16557.1 DNA replication and repair protein RecF [Paenibacillus chitinolyticus]GKS14477.1 DNA replication and repair protein RecF [Paenibacillus chitinolyticus]
MFVKRLLLEHYRNYPHVEISTDRNVNIFVGPNAQGKTNLLESIYVLALTKSHRTHQEKELIQWQEDHARLFGEVERKYGMSTLELSISGKGKKAKVNGLEQKKLSQYVGALNVVMFAPEDLEIVKGSPGIRRRFLDMEIGQVYPSYLYDLTQYQKVLVQRNNLLKQSYPPSAANSSMLDVWNEQLAAFGVKIMKKRQSFIKKLQSWAEQIHQGITNGKEMLRVEYAPSFADGHFEDESVLLDRFMIKLSQIKEQEMRRGVSLIGPHRDDLLFCINDKDVQTYGSQGQQRTTALSLKLAEIELIREEVGEYPVLLLDDVLSELDEYRQTQLIQTFQKKVQTFITTTGLESVHLDQLDHAAVFHVSSGSVIDRS